MPEETVAFTINDQEASAAPGETILQVARRMGIWIPTLCYNEAL